MADPFGIVKNKQSIADWEAKHPMADQMPQVAGTMQQAPAPQPNVIDAPLQPLPKPQGGPFDVVTEPSAYEGLPKDLATILEATATKNKSISDRVFGANLPKYAFQLGAGATEAATLGIIEPKHPPMTTGEALLRGAGQLLGASFIPLGPVVKAASKYGTAAKVGAGALANILATEVETRGQATKGRLMLDAAFGAVFGKLYKTDEHWGRAYQNLTSTPQKIINDFKAPVAEAEKPAQQLLLPDYHVPRADFEAPFAAPESATSRTLRAGSQAMTRGGAFDELAPYEGARSTAPRVDILGPDKGVSPLAITGKGLFDEAGVKGRPGGFKRVTGDKAQKVLNRLGLHPDKDVRDSAKMAKDFIENSEEIPNDFVRSAMDVREGKSDSRISVPFQLGEDLVPRRRLSVGNPGGARESIRPVEYVFADIERKTGGRIPAYSHFWDAAQAREVARRQTGKVGAEIVEHLRGVNKDTDQGVKALWEAGTFNDRAIARHAYPGLTDRQVEKSDAAYNVLSNLWNRNFPGHSFDKFMQETLPAMRLNDPATMEVLRRGGAVEEVERWAANHEMSLKETRATRFSADMVRALSMKEHFDPQYKNLMKIAGDPTYPEAYRDFVSKWARDTRGTAAKWVEDWTPRYQRFLKRLGIKNVEERDARDVLDNYVTLTHAGLVGFRIPPLLHNLFNGWQTGAARVGIPAYWNGLKRAFTKEGMELAKANGMIDEAAHEAEALRELAAPGKITRTIRQVASAGLKLYGGIDDLHRATLFLAGHDRFLEAAKKAGSNVEKLTSESGLYRLHEALREHILDPWAKGDVRKAAALAGTHFAQATQWVYRGEYRPRLVSGDLGRTLGQFGVWPLNYLEYNRQMLHSVKMPPLERAKWLRDFTFTNGSIIMAMGAAGAAVGLSADAMKNTAKWTFAGPISYAGGPLVDFFMALPKIQNDIQDGIFEGNAAKAFSGSAWRQMKADAIAAVPGSGLGRDIARAKGPLIEQPLLGVPGVGSALSSLEAQNVLPSQSGQEEVFRLATGIGVQSK